MFVAARQAALADLPLPPDVTGMWLDRDWRSNVELILRLHPDTRRIAFVSGPGTTPSTAVEFRQVAASYRDRFEPIELTDRTFEEMLEQVTALPEHTVILVGLFLRDRAGRTFTNAEVAERVAHAASVPVYSALDVHVGRGIVGGYVVRWDQQAQRAAALALRVLRGERLGPADATSEGTNAHVFDARLLKRWRIDRRRLPPGSVVLFHEPSLWELYRGYVIGAVSVVLIQGGLIGILLVQRYSAPPRPAEPHRAPPVRDAPLGPLDQAVVLPRRGGRPADRGRAPAHRGGFRRGSGHHLGAGRPVRRGPHHALVDPRGRRRPSSR